MNFLFQKLTRGLLSRKVSLVQYIKVEEGQFFFDLSEQALLEIDYIRTTGSSLSIPYSLLSSLLCHALFKRELRTFKGKHKTYVYLQPGLTFYTCYSDSQEDQKLEATYLTSRLAEKKKVMRSLISPDGDILHQVCRDFLQHPYYLEISTAHYWLTTQLLNHLRTNLNWIPRLAWLVLAFLSWRKLVVQSLTIWSAIWFISPFVIWPVWSWFQPLIIRWILDQILSSSFFRKVIGILRI